jgi:hypothetical protein
VQCEYVPLAHAASSAALIERQRIAQWLRDNNAEICDWFPTAIAGAIIDGEHWGDTK